ncbi:MAG: hypothetical protein PHR47_02480 [Candidatus Pacebacteria bacterium]|nr:hypothetical protein [Candidatus Paceibacterota bacterium]
MITKELLDYIAYQLDHNVSWEEVRRDLAGSGWALNVLDDAYSQIMAKRKEASAAQVPSALVEVSPKTENASVTSGQPGISNPEKNLMSNPATSNPAASNNVFIKKNSLSPTENGISVPGIPPQEEPNKKGKLIGLIAAIIIALVLIGGSAFAYFSYINSDNVLQKIFANSQTIDSGEFTGKIAFEYSPSENIKQEITNNTNIGINTIKGELNINGSYNFKDANNAKMDITVNIDSKAENDAKYELNSEWKVIDNNLYGKLNNLVAPQELDQYVSPAKSLMLSKWIKLNSNQEGENISTALANIRNEIRKNSNELSKSLTKASNLQFQGFETYDNTLCSKFKVSFDKQKTKDFLINLAKDNGLTDEEITESFKDYEKSYEEFIKNTDINITVGVFDSLIHRASFKFTGSTEQGSGSLNINISSKKENTDIKIENVNESTDLEEIFEKLVSVTTTVNQTIDDSIKKAINDAKDIADTYKMLKDTYINFDTSINGERLIRENINSWGGNAVTIFTSKEKYCISKDLINEVGTSWCLDSSNFVGNGTCDKTKITCNIASNSTDSTQIITPEGPITPTIIVPTSEKSEVQELIDSLASSLQIHNTAKGTFLGYISSADGIKEVKKINEQEGGDALVVATSKTKFCIMKKVNDEPSYYCVDSTGYSGKSNNCTSKNISCE